MENKAANEKKFIIDRKFPDVSEVNKYREFDKVYKNYKTMGKPVFKNFLQWGASLVAVGSIITTLYLTLEDKPDTVTALHTGETTDQFIKPPLPGKEKTFVTFEVDAVNGGDFGYESGTRILVPSDAFVTSNGQPISGKVMIRYREFRTPVEIFLSGIPMKYDSAGTGYQLESAGMLEIKAFAGNLPLMLKAGKAIRVEMLTRYDGSEYNYYELDTNHRRWIYKGKDSISNPERERYPRPEDYPAKDFVTGPEPVPMIEPKKSNPDRFQFSINFEKEEFPELAAYDKMLFEVNDENFNPAFYDVRWERITLEEGLTSGLFRVRLKKADSILTVNVIPVFDEADYHAAMEKFKKNFENYSTNIRKQEEAAIAKRTRIEKEEEKFGQPVLTGSFRRFVRSLMVTSLGICNIDRPVLLPPFQLAMDRILSTQRQQTPDFSIVYVAEKGKNTILRFAPGEQVRYHEGPQTIMWTILRDNRIAFLRRSSFNSKDPVPVIPVDQDKALDEIRKFTEEI